MLLGQQFCPPWGLIHLLGWGCTWRSSIPKVLSGIVFCIMAILCILCPSTGSLLGQLLMPLLPVLCLLFPCLSLWSWCCGVPFLFSVKHTLDRASATGIVFLGLYLTWMSNIGHFNMNHWNLDKVRDWFFSKICSSGPFLLLTFTPVGNIQIFVGHMWLPGSLFLCWSTLTLLEWDTLIPFLQFFSAPLSLICFIHASTPRVLTSHWNIVVLLGSMT